MVGREKAKGEECKMNSLEQMTNQQNGARSHFRRFPATELPAITAAKDLFSASL